MLRPSQPRGHPEHAEEQQPSTFCPGQSVACSIATHGVLAVAEHARALVIGVRPAERTIASRQSGRTKSPHAWIRSWPPRASAARPRQGRRRRAEAQGHEARAELGVGRLHRGEEEDEPARPPGHGRGRGVTKSCTPRRKEAQDEGCAAGIVDASAPAGARRSRWTASSISCRAPGGRRRSAARAHGPVPAFVFQIVPSWNFAAGQQEGSERIEHEPRHERRAQARGRGAARAIGAAGCVPGGLLLQARRAQESALVLDHAFAAEESPAGRAARRRLPLGMAGAPPVCSRSAGGAPFPGSGA